MITAIVAFVCWTVVVFMAGYYWRAAGDKGRRGRAFRFM